MDLIREEVTEHFSKQSMKRQIRRNSKNSPIGKEQNPRQREQQMRGEQSSQLERGCKKRLDQLCGTLKQPLRRPALEQRVLHKDNRQSMTHGFLILTSLF